MILPDDLLVSGSTKDPQRQRLFRVWMVDDVDSHSARFGEVVILGWRVEPLFWNVDQHGADERALWSCKRGPVAGVLPEL